MERGNLKSMPLSGRAFATAISDGLAEFDGLIGKDGVPTEWDAFGLEVSPCQPGSAVMG